MSEWIKKLFASASQQRMIERTCPKCGKTFSLPEDVQYWPDYCLECRMMAPAQTVTRKCRGCKTMFTFLSTDKNWPDYCRECRAEREGKKRRQKIKM